MAPSFSARRAAPAALLLLGQLTGTAADYTFYCRYTCGTDEKSVCVEGKCKPPADDCHFVAEQPFVDGEVCNEYLQSGPVCHAETQQCEEAANFQLVYDRLQDISRTYKAKDWSEVARTFNETAVAFSPGGDGFIMGRDNISRAIEGFYNKTGAPNVTAIVSQVLTTMPKSSAAKVATTSRDKVHSIGMWTPQKGNDGSAPYYAVWVDKSDGHWVMDTLIVAQATPSAAAALANRAAPEDDDLFKQISDRMAEFARIYNTGNFSGLVAEMYTGSAAVIPADGRRPVPASAASDFFNEQPLAKEAKLSPKIVTRGQDPNVAHEIGFADSTNTGYYARWARGSDSEQWKIEAHCLAVFPKLAAQMASEVIV